MKNGERHGILYPSTMDGGGGVHTITRIDKDVYSCVTKDIVTDEVVLTEERISHVLGSHPQEQHVSVLERLAEALEVPDYILRDPDPKTAVVLKEFLLQNERYRIILKLATPDMPAHPKNSVITAFYISEKKWRKYLRNKTVLYKRAEM